MTRTILMLVLLTVGLPLVALAEPTPLSVYVLSRDAKFIGSSVGGVRITLRDADTGEVLAQGVTEGSTGNTDVIMREPRKRDASAMTTDAAHFATTLDLDAPTRVQVTAFGPLDYPHSANSVSATRLVLPGQSLSAGSGWILEMPGLVVQTHDVPALVQRRDGEATIPVRARVSMMCGCPLTPDGLWDSNAFEIRARLTRDGRTVTTGAMSYAGEASEFQGELTAGEPGQYRVEVRALQPATGNAGLSTATVVVD